MFPQFKFTNRIKGTCYLNDQYLINNISINNLIHKKFCSCTNLDIIIEI